MKKVMFQFTDGESREVDVLPDGKLQYQGKPVDIRAYGEQVVLSIDRSFVVQSSYILTGSFYRWEEIVTGVQVEQDNWLINLRPDDYLILRQDGTVSVLPGNRFNRSGRVPHELFNACPDFIVASRAIVAAKVRTAGHVYGVIWQGHGVNALCGQTGTPVLFLLDD